MANSTDARLAILETETKNIKTLLDEIKNNHLHHLDAKIDRIDERTRKNERKIEYFGGAFLVLIAAIEIISKLLLH